MAVQITIQDNAKWSYFIFKTHGLFSSDEDTQHILHIGIQYLDNPHKINSPKSQKLYCYKLHLFSAITLRQKCTLSTTSMCLALDNKTVHIQ